MQFGNPGDVTVRVLVVDPASGTNVDAWSAAVAPSLARATRDQMVRDCTQSVRAHIRLKQGNPDVPLNVTTCVMHPGPRGTSTSDHRSFVVPA